MYSRQGDKLNRNFFTKGDVRTTNAFLTWKILRQTRCRFIAVASARIKFIAQRESREAVIKAYRKEFSLAPCIYSARPGKSCGYLWPERRRFASQARAPKQFQRRADYSRGSLECRRRDSQRLYTVSEYNRIRHRDFVTNLFPCCSSKIKKQAR